MARDLNKQEQEIKSMVMDKLEDAVDDYFEDFRSKSSDGTSLPTINEIEDILVELSSKTRDIYLETVSEMISKCNESDLIDSKKPNSKRKG